ncbi:hypothetical protein [Prevotella intermedia]|uniref:hypothetical protein n=1 Tax=Prevotella intermedia TaxID=28131 RepID=UPI0012FE65B8|nr:hypothetical protein [Prevotella intermedia]
MKIKLITMPDNLRVKELLDIKGGVSDELQSQLEGCQKCNCCFGNENKSKGTVIKNNK